MRILVTGVKGQVGSALAVRLRDRGTLIAADRTVLDLSKPDEIAAKLRQLAPDVIINPAAYTAVDRAESDSELAFRVNSEAPGAMARWAAARDVPILHFSTDYVFDGSGTHAWLETDVPRPLSVYGHSKLAGELAVREAGGPHLIVRTSWVYAARGSNFLRTIVRLAEERLELRIVADQFGAPTSAATIADAVAALLGRTEDIRIAFAHAHGLVHLAASGVTSWHGFATAIVDGLRVAGARLMVERIVPIASADYPTKAQRPLNSRLDLSRLSETFGMVTPSWAEGLSKELQLLVAELN